MTEDDQVITIMIDYVPGKRLDEAGILKWSKSIFGQTISLQA
jgi:hypothetical protein